MKRFFISVFFSISVFTVAANSQAFEKIRVGEVWQEVINSSYQILSNPKLILVQTVNGPFNFGGMPLNISFDINTGTAELWVFILVDSDDTTHLLSTFAAKSTSYGYMFMHIDEYNLDLSNFMSEYISFPEEYVFDSDSLADVLRANQDFMDFYNNNQPFNYFSIEFFMNSKFDDINLGKPYWFVSMRTPEIYKLCTIQGITKEMTCEETNTNVNENPFITFDDYLIYPNPASEMIYMNISEPVKNLKITNTFGEIVKEFSINEINDFNANKNFSFKVSKLSAGVYFVIIDNRFSKKLLIER